MTPLYLRPAAARLLLVGVVAVLAVAPAAPAAAQTSNPVRLTGGSVVEAALAFSRATFDRAGVVLIGRDDLFADSLASGALQGDDSPLLLTPTDRLDEAVAAEIDRLQASRAIILGGTAAISQDVEDQLDRLGLSTTRSEGPTRFDTAVAVARQRFEDVTEAIIARAFPREQPSQAFVDALAAGAFAADTGLPILLSDTERLNEATAAYLEGSDITDVTLVGGVAALNAQVEADLVGLGISVRRLSGDERAATAIDIADTRGFRSAADAERVVLVDGTRDDAWAPGFAAAAHAARFDAPVVLAVPDGLPAPTEGFIDPGTSATTLVCAPFVAQVACDDARDLLEIEPPAGTPVTPVTGRLPAPELASAVAQGSETGETVVVRFTFDGEIEGADGADPARFLLYGADLEPSAAIGAEIVRDQNVVLAEFPGQSYQEATTATVDAGAVASTGGTANPEGAVPLKDAAQEPGRTLAPDLEEVGGYQADGRTVDFTFDEAAALAGAPSDYVLVDATGTIYRGTVLVEGNLSSTHRVSFGSELTSDAFAGVVRGYVEAGTVNDTDAMSGPFDNPLQSADVARDGSSNNPDLLAIAFDAENSEALYTFDEPITLGPGAEAAFRVYDTTGAQVVATDAARSTRDSASIVATFSTGAVDGRTVGASVLGDAVTGTSGAVGRGNDADEVGGSVPFAAGATEAPLLVDARVAGVSPNRRMVYVFTQDVAIGSPDRFRLYAPDGDQLTGTEAVRNGENTDEVLVTFEDASQAELADAVLATVDGGAVTAATGGPGNFETPVPLE